MQLTTHFTDDELIHSILAETEGIDNRPSEVAAANLYLLAVNVLERLRNAVGAPLHISSGYRSPELNRAVGGAQNSQHMMGQAADVYVVGCSPEKLLLIALKAGIDFDQAVIEPRWLHISYNQFDNRGQMLKKTEDGFAVYKPKKGEQHAG
jgi:hypothetical protein